MEAVERNLMTDLFFCDWDDARTGESAEAAEYE